MATGIGIDVHPYYQRGADWARIKRDTQVGWAYVKASDGTRRYTKQVGTVLYVPDTHVNGARAHGIPVGAYHYAQLGDPVAQANVLSAEDVRLGTNLPPMLDMEDPFTGNAATTTFAKAFLNRMVQAGHRPCVYLSSSWARTMRPDLWGIPGLIIWIASYGPNDGVQHPLTGGYPGRVDVHQYTSTGKVNGIGFDTDLNRAYIDITQEASQVALKDELFQFKTPDGRTVGVTALDMLGNMYAERFYGSSTIPWAGPSGRAIDMGELAETPTASVELPEDFAEQLAQELVDRGVGGVSPEMLAEAFKAAATTLEPGETVPPGDAR